MQRDATRAKDGFMGGSRAGVGGADLLVELTEKENAGNGEAQERSRTFIVLLSLSGLSTFRASYGAGAAGRKPLVARRFEGTIP